MYMKGKKYLLRTIQKNQRPASDLKKVYTWYMYIKAVRKKKKGNNLLSCRTNSFLKYFVGFFFCPPIFHLAWSNRSYFIQGFYSLCFWFYSVHSNTGLKN